MLLLEWILKIRTVLDVSALSKAINREGCLKHAESLKYRTSCCIFLLNSSLVLSSNEKSQKLKGWFRDKHFLHKCLFVIYLFYIPFPLLQVPTLFYLFWLLSDSRANSSLHWANEWLESTRISLEFIWSFWECIKICFLCMCLYIV